MHELQVYDNYEDEYDNGLDLLSAAALTRDKEGQRGELEEEDEDENFDSQKKGSVRVRVRVSAFYNYSYNPISIIVHMN